MPITVSLSSDELSCTAHAKVAGLPSGAIKARSTVFYLGSCCFAFTDCTSASTDRPEDSALGPLPRQTCAVCMNEDLQQKAFPKHTLYSLGYKEPDIDVANGSICFVSYFGLFQKAKQKNTNQGQSK